MTQDSDTLPLAARDVLAHLAYASTVVRKAWVEVGDERMHARFGYPDEASNTLPVWFERNASAMPYVTAAGASICVRYTCDEVDYVWNSNVHAQVNATDILVQVPAEVNREERRAAPRVRTAPDDQLVLELRRPDEGVVPTTVVDVSSGGLSFATKGIAWTQGERISARLHLDNGELLRLVLSVVSVRTHPSGVALCGCSYASITNQARQQLASFVYERLRTDR